MCSFDSIDDASGQRACINNNNIVGNHWRDGIIIIISLYYFSTITNASCGAIS